jgi:hypothetical protein
VGYPRRRFLGTAQRLIVLSFPKTLLYTTTPPGEGSLAQCYLREVCSALPKDRTYCYGALSANNAPWVPSADLEWLPIEFHDVPQEYLFGTARGFVPDMMHSFLSRGRHRLLRGKICGEVIEFGRAVGVELIVAVLASPSIIRTTRAIADALDARIISVVWNKPHTVTTGLDPFSRNTVMRHFQKVMKQSEQVLVPTEELRRHISARYGANPTVLKRPFDEDMIADVVGLPRQFVSTRSGVSVLSRR